MPTEDISRLIFDRESARLQKDFAQADSLRESLHAGGVSIFDDTHLWRTNDGRSGTIPTFAEIETSTGNGYQSGGGYAGSNLEPHIKDLVQRREEARARKDFGLSDSVRAELKTLGVEIFDKEKMWRGKDGLTGVILGYRGAGMPPTDVEITTLVCQREKARQNHDWATSDMIRDELKVVGVDIIDRERRWTASDGRQGVVPLWNDGAGKKMVQGGVIPAVQPQQMHHGAQQMHHGGLNQFSAGAGIPIPAPLLGMSQQQIYALAAAAVQNPGMMQPMPVQRMPMQHMPVQRTPRVVQPVGGAVGSGATAVALRNALSFCSSSSRPLSDEEIAWLVEIRERTRKAKDFGGADQLKAAMMGRGVIFDQNAKLWSTSDGRQGGIPPWSDLVD